MNHHTKIAIRDLTSSKLRLFSQKDVIGLFKFWLALSL